MRFFYLPRTTLRGLLVLAIIIFAVSWYLEHSSRPTNELWPATAIDSQVIATTRQASRPAFKDTLHPCRFNPNEADSLTLRKLGLPVYVVRHIVHYREKGGRFRRPADLQKIYGMLPEHYETLKPFIILPQEHAPQPAKAFSRPRQTDSSLTVVTPQRTVSDKFTQHVLLDINQVDSITLIRIPGIGPYYCHRLLRRRKLLGGYVSITQLDEIKNFPEAAKDWFYVADGTKPRQMSINHLPFKELLRHPYLNFEQVKAIFNLRNSVGKLQYLEQLSNLPEFTSEDIERLRPYISF